MVQWLGLGAFTATEPGSIPGQGTMIPQAGSTTIPQAGNTAKKKKKNVQWDFRHVSGTVIFLGVQASKPAEARSV